MKQSRAFELIQGWERRFPVGEWSVGGIRVWPLIRIQLGYTLEREAGAAPLEGGARLGQWSQRVRAVSDLRHTLRARLGDAAHEAALHQADVLFLMHTTCRTRLGQGYYDMYCDPLADLLEREGRSSLALEAAPYPAAYRLPRHRASHLVQHRSVLAEVEGNALGALRVRTPAVLPGYDGLGEELARSGFGAALPPLNRLRVRAASLRSLARYFVAVLERVRPRVALAVCYYNDIGMAFNMAARAAGVVSVDLQHGVLRGNCAYDGWAAVPAGGYELLPEVFWCWSDRDAAVIDGWASKARQHRSLVGGQPWTCFWLDQANTFAAPFRARVERLRAQLGGELSVLLALQWDHGFTELMQRAIAQAPPTWRFWIRLHPQMQAQRVAIEDWIRRHAAGKCAVDEPSDLPLPLLLASADVHCTRHSTVVQEAAAAGVPSVVLDPAALDWYSSEAAAGLVTLATSPEEVVAAIGAAAQARQQRRSGSLGSPERMRDALSQLLDSGRIEARRA